MPKRCLNIWFFFCPTISINWQPAISVGHRFMFVHVKYSLELEASISSLIISTANKHHEDADLIVFSISGNSPTRKLLVFPNKHGILASVGVRCYGACSIQRTSTQATRF